jgi:uncharacterized OB-fold protein
MEEVRMFVVDKRPIKETCAECGSAYIPTKSYQRFCEDRCRKRWHKRNEIEERRARIETAVEARRQGQGQSQSAEDILALLGVEAKACEMKPTTPGFRRF